MSKGLEFWEQVVFHPQALIKTSELLQEHDEKILEILDGVMNYRFGEFEPNFTEIMEFDFFKGKKVLEIGSGCGSDAVAMTKIGAEVTCVDVLPTNIAVVGKNHVLRGLPVHAIYVPDIMQLDNIRTDFDVLYSFGCIHHIKNGEEVFQHLLNFLKPGATIMLMLYTHQVNREGYTEGDVVEFYDEKRIEEMFGDRVQLVSISTFHGGDFWKVKGKLKGQIIEKSKNKGAILQLVTDHEEKIIVIEDAKPITQGIKLEPQRLEEDDDNITDEVTEEEKVVECETKEIKPIEEIKPDPTSQLEFLKKKKT